MKEIESLQWPDPEIIKIITDLADLYEIPSETPTRQIKTKFLWFPKTIEGQTKWLVTASWQEQFIEVIDEEAMELGALNCFCWIWKPVKWIEK